jgi:hypothetical protein
MSKKLSFFLLLTLGILGFNSLNLVINKPTKALPISPVNLEQTNPNIPNNSITQLPNNPYKIGDYYNATSYFKCSVGNASHNKQCPSGIVRKGNGKASIVVLFPNGYEVQYDFKNGDVTSTFEGDLTWGKDGDDWYIGIDNNLFIIIPDAAVYGG